MSSASARLTRKSDTNFYYAFLLLPEAKRRAIFAVYSFCRKFDDCVDEEDGGAEKGLAYWLDEVEKAYLGTPATELGRDLAAAVARFPIPRSCFVEIAEGCRMDLTIKRYATFEDLKLYCRRVASAVGLASIEIFGYQDPSTREFAVELGLALQLTNILRDIGADATRGRLYLPLEDLNRFGVREAELLAFPQERGPAGNALRELLLYEAEQARSHYNRASKLLPPRDRHAMLAAEIMGAIYGSILDELVRRGFPRGTERVRLTRFRKAMIAASTLWRNRLGA